MTPIAIAPRTNQRSSIGSGFGNVRISASGDRAGNVRSGFLGGRSQPAQIPAPLQAIEPELPQEAPKPKQGESLERVVRRIPTLYVIALFAVVVGCAVFMIWNTLRVNALTLQKSHNEEQIALAEQRLIKLRADEMQLMQSDRIHDLARAKLGMIDISGEDLVIVR